MARFLAIILFCGLSVVVVNGGVLTTAKEPATAPAGRVNFEAVGKYLTSVLPDNEDAQVNLAQLRDAMEGFQEAARMVLDLANSGGRCDNRIMSILRALDEAGVHPTGGTRIEKVMGAIRNKATEVCVRHMIGDATRMWKGLDDPSLASFLQVFKPKTLFETPTNDDGQEQAEAKAEEEPKLSLKGVASVLKELSKESYRLNIDHEPHFEYAFEHHLLEPCRKILPQEQLQNKMASLTLAISREKGDLPKRVYEVPFTINTPRGLYTTSVRAELRDMALIERACSLLETMDADAKANLFNAIKSA